MFSNRKLSNFWFVLLLLFFWVCTQSAKCQTITAANNTATTATAVTVTITVTSGNLAVICADENQNRTSTLSITDSASQGGWTQAGGYAMGPTASFREGCFYHCNSAALTTITATWSGAISGRIGGRALSVSSIVTTSCLDASAATAGTDIGTSLASGSLTTTNANDVLVDDVGTSAINTVTPGTGFTKPTNGGSQRGAIMDKIVSATQSGLTTTPTWGTSGSASENFFAFKISGGVACTPTLTLMGIGRCD